jgi:hypothetical protein
VSQIDISKPIDLQQFQHGHPNQQQQLIFRLNEDGTVVGGNQQFIFNGSGTAIQLTPSGMTNVEAGGNHFQLVSTLNQHQMQQQQQQQRSLPQMAQAVGVVQPGQETTKKAEPKKRRKKNEQDDSGAGGGEKTVQKLISASNEQMNINK